MNIGKKIVLLLLMLLLVYWLAAQEPGRYDVVIHEIFADPTPSRGMPASEFVEIRNRSGSNWNLRNWQFTNGSTLGRINSNYVLQPDSAVVLCSSSSVQAFLSFGNALALSNFPSLDNDGDTLILLSPSGTVVHALAWNKDWYRNDAKRDGGWSMEMMDITRPCLGKENWAASNDPRGGTPGKRNSVASVITDSSKAVLLYSYMSDSLSALMVFSEPIRDLTSTTAIQTDPSLQVVSASLKPPLYNVLAIKLNGLVRESEMYNLGISSISDCSGNISALQKAKTGRFSIPAENDLVINEILFNPQMGGHDYVELLNRSNKNFDLGRLMLANRDGNHRIASMTPVSLAPLPIYPGEYLTLTTNEGWVRAQFPLPRDARLLETASLPSFPDDEGEVILLNQQAMVVDELHYDEKWHFELIGIREGVSLERVSAFSPTQDKANWHSASTSSGYGTPGYRNSQSWPNNPDADPISLNTKLISPDMDGRDDFLLIRYQFPKPGYVATVLVFDGQGRTIRTIARGSLLGTNGFFRWDGLSESGEPVGKGVYIILTEYFDTLGKTHRIKRTVGVYR
jgi:hypothetical protein